MRLVLCDGNRIFGESLAAALAARGHHVVAVTTSVPVGLDAVGDHLPDACLLDLGSPRGENGQAAVPDMRRRSPGTAIVIFWGRPDPVAVADMKRLGVAGVLSKAQNVSHILQALDEIAVGGTVFEPMGTVSHSRVLHSAVPRPSPGVTELTPREKEVLRRIVAGQSTPQMAREMSITTSTLRTYVKNLLTKLGTHSRLQAAALARRDGLLTELSA
jgi:DNA-binding NarL/FixJ family response regulator